MKFNDNKLYYSSDLELSALRNIKIKKIIKLLKKLDIVNKLLRRAEKDLESEYNSNIIIINVLNKSIFRSI